MCNTLSRVFALACLLFSFFIPSNLWSQTLNFDWVAHWGSTSVENANGLLIDSAGNTYTIGGFAGTIDFDPGADTAYLSSGYSSTFITKLDPDGGFLWVRAFLGSAVTGGYRMALDDAGDLYAIGAYSGTTDLDPGPGTFIMPDNGTLSGYVCKLSPGGDFIWAKGLYGPNVIIPRNLTVDGNRGVYVTGYFSHGVDFDPGPGIDSLHSAGADDVFVLKLDTSGAYQWARRMGGPLTDFGNSVHVDATGQVYCTGSFQQQADFDPGAGVFNLTSNGGADIYMLALDSSGNFSWANGIGGTGDEYAAFTDWTQDGHLLLAGNFQMTVDFDPGAGTLTLAGNATDGFVASYSTTGAVAWVRQLVATGAVQVNDAYDDALGRTHVLGAFYGQMDADPSSGSFILASVTAANNDGYYVVLDTARNLLWADHTEGLDNDHFEGGDITSAGEVSVLASFTNTTDYDLGPGVSALNCLGITDIALLRMFSVDSIPNTIPERIPAWRITPNPVLDGPLEVDLQALEVKLYTLRIVDAMGTVILQDAAQGGTVKALDVSRLPTGIFQLMVMDGRERMTKKFMVLR